MLSGDASFGWWGFLGIQRQGAHAIGECTLKEKETGEKALACCFWSKIAGAL